MLTYDDGFSGGGLATVGAKAAGLTPIGAVEYDSAIANVYRQNLGDHMTVASIQDIDWTQRAVPFWRHMSPVCTRASQANNDGEESELDIAMAHAVAQSIEVHPPKFSLENVWQYRNFESFKIIYRALRKHSYDVQFWHLNSADYGVPQTRKRLILVASRVGRVKRPTPTHKEVSADTGQMSIFDPLPAWIGWYEAIEDLIPTLPDSEFAPWQLERLPSEIKDTFLMASGASGFERAVIGQGICDRMRPSHTIAAQPTGGMPRAFIVDGQSNDHGSCVTLRQGDAPMFTISASMEKRPTRAFLMRSANTKQEWGKGHRDDIEPAYTVTTGDLHSRAFLASISTETPPRYADEPAHTTTSSEYKNMRKAWLSRGRVVKMTPRALGRFQSLPDWYELPSKDSLACAIIGNGVPCKLMEQVIKANI